MKIIIDGGKDWLNLEQGEFRGDANQAKAALQDFANKNKINYKSAGYGYGQLIINRKIHDITPYGIDILMMLEFCGINLEQAPAAAAAAAAAAVEVEIPRM